MELSDIQYDYLINSTYDINLATGSIRSGKTFIQLIRWHEFLVNQAIPNIDCLISAKKGDGAERNLIKPFLDFVESENCRGLYKYTRMPRCLTYLPKNISCWVEGANDEGSEARIRGMTAQAHLGDEVTLYPKSFFYQAIGRCSSGLRIKFYTCNPDAPSHYIKEEIIDNPKVNKNVWHFNLLDNPSLDPAYKIQLESMYTGVFRQRMIEGLWVQSEGIIYDSFNRNKSVIKDYPATQIKEYVLGIDWGYEHPLSIVLCAIDHDENYYIIDEIYRKHQLIDQSLKIIMESKGWFDLKRGSVRMPISYSYCDTNRPEQMVEFNRLTGIPTMGALKSVLEGIQAVQSTMTVRQNGLPRLFIIDKCVNLLKEIGSYAWKQNKSGVGRDEPIKEQDDLSDALRYLIFTRERNRPRMITSNPFRS